MTSQEAFKKAGHMARYGHRDWVVWPAGGGTWEALELSAWSLKQAMLAVGTKGKVRVITASKAQGHTYGWRSALVMLSNLSQDRRDHG